MQTLSEIKALLADRGLTPRHRFGQNFLHDHNHLTRLLEAAGIGEGDLVLEIGPGTGTLTEALLDRSADVICCEIDRDLADLVEDRLGSRITLVRGDCLETGRRLASPIVEAIGGRPFTLVANLPYDAATPVMVDLAIGEHPCLGQFVTIQKEVGERLLADPDTKAWGPLSVLVRARCAVERIGVLPPGCFWPAPAVTSMMVGITPTAPLPSDMADFASFVSRLFSTRRKQLGGVLGADVVEQAGIDPTWRCERLDVEALWRLFHAAQ